MILNQQAIHSQQKSVTKIKEHLRNNQYKIGDDLTTGVLSGDEICDNIILIGKMNSLDLYKITYNTSFIRGRSFTKSLSKQINESSRVNNIVKLELVDNNATDNCLSKWSGKT